MKYGANPEKDHSGGLSQDLLSPGCKRSDIKGNLIFALLVLQTYPLKMNAEDIYNEIRETILSIAKTDRKKAEIKVKTLEIRYQ